MTRYLTLPASADSSSRFLDALARALEGSGRRALWIRRRHVVLFREGDTMNSVRPFPWGSDSREAPRLTRIAVNQSDIEVTRRARILLGFAPEARPGHDERLDLELTVLDEELVAFAPWLARRMDPAVPIPAPPVACDSSPEDWKVTVYEWSRTAWAADEAWRAKEKAARAQRKARRQAFLDECARREGATRPRSTSGGQAQVGKEGRHV